MTANIIYIAIAFSKNRYNVVWPLKILRSVVTFLVSVLFMPVFSKIILIKIYLSHCLIVLIPVK